MIIKLRAALTNVHLHSEIRPDGRFIYAICYEDGKASGVWFPEGYEAEDPGDKLVTSDRPHAAPRNPLQVIVDGKPIAHPDRYGMWVMLGDGRLALVFNAKNGAADRRGPG